MTAPLRPKMPPPPSSPWLSPPALAALRAADIAAHRLYSTHDAWIERFNEDALLSYKTDAARDAALAQLPDWSHQNGLPLRRVFGKFIPRQNDGRVAPSLLSGDATLPLTTSADEAGLHFALDFAAGYSAGLFIDQRANRAFVRRSRPKRLLNTFAYTCSFSVVAASIGAETVSVDLSKKSLDRGRGNFALNGLDTSGHRFLADDVLEVLPRLARRGEQFDTIILDPPTFSRGHRGRRFQVEADLEALLVAALEVATAQARVLVSTNCARLSERPLEQIARYALKVTRRSADFHREPELPDIPREFAARTLWLALR
jgi:23S rRNA (cytosine1962-C5)-methyltransferase